METEKFWHVALVNKNRGYELKKKNKGKYVGGFRVRKGKG